MREWGVEKHGARVLVDEHLHLDFSLPLFIDIEDDEKGNFVGIGLTQDGENIYYRQGINRQEMEEWSQVSLTGHNVKYDAKQLTKWGIPINPCRLRDDTILMSYVVNSTKESHSLKSLGKELGYVWPTYSELVGKGRKKVTLDKQPVDLVAEYCAMDVLVTYKLFNHFRQRMNSTQWSIYNQIEMPLMRVLFEMELKGVTIDVTKLKQLDGRFREQLERHTESLSRLSNKALNPNSNRQVAEVLESRGIPLPVTPKGNRKVDKHTLSRHTDDEFVRELLEYNKIEKLYSTYTQGLLKLPTLPKVYTTYNQIVSNRSQENERGISTNRLSSSSPNLQQIPSRSEEGKLIRELFIPEEGKMLIRADYNAIEMRVLAHFSGEKVLIDAFREGKDVHEETAKVLGVSRDIGKTLNFAANYGAGVSKIAKTANISEEEAKRFLETYWKRLPSVTAWIERVKYDAARRKGIYTLMKRFIPIPNILCSDLGERFHHERTAVNYTIQGSAAEILKLAMIKLRSADFLPLLTVHDELVFEANPSDYYGNGVTRAREDIKSIMESVVQLSVPLVAEVEVGENWQESKNG